MDYKTLIGTTGALLVLIAFVLNETHKWSDGSLVYDLTNFLGSSLLVYYALALSSWPFTALNAVWLLVSLRDTFTDLRRKK